MELTEEYRNLGERLRSQRKVLGYTLNDVSDRLSALGFDVSFKTISRWENGDGIPNACQFLALCRALRIQDLAEYFSGEATEETLNAEGRRKVEEYRADLIASGRYRREEDELPFISLPVYSLRVSAGTGDIAGQDPPDPVLLPSSRVPAGAEFAVVISGDSMEPVYHDGQMVYVKKQETLQSGQPGIFLYDGSVYLKIYEQSRETDCCAVLRSYNSAYAPIAVNPDLQFCVLGRVLL